MGVTVATIFGLPSFKRVNNSRMAAKYDNFPADDINERTNFDNMEHPGC